jgi:two-component system cell cycle sensor histidine kinase/response regulator CckA
MINRRAPTANDRPDRVLVIDDEPVIHELVREVMHTTDIVSAATVAEARACVERGDVFDVALVDKNLPDGSGIELVRWLRIARPEAEVVMITAYPSMDSALEAMSLGAMDYLIKPMRDINELRLRVGNACNRVRQRRAESQLLTALRESEERYRELFEATPDAVVVLDAETREITEANGAAERLYGRPRSELVRQLGASLIAGDHAPIVENGIVKRRDVRADGSTFPVEVSTGSAHRDARSFVVEVVRDVSERERAEAERLDLEKRLARAGRLEALGRMAAGIAHDVNNLLCVIRTNNELATEALEAGHVVRDDLAQIEQAVVSAADLTRRLLAFSGRQLVRAQVLDLNELVGNVARMLARTLEAKARLVLDLSRGPAMVKMDPGQLEQVIANLAVNARDAMPRGGTITISTAATDGGEVCLAVRDTGVGIPPEILGDIFEPFFTTKGNHGTGLGLATVKEIVTRGGGRIGIQSQVGTGTQFEIHLPTSNEQPRAQSAELAAPIAGGRGEVILLVEDDRLVRGVTRRRLAGAGYAVHETSSAEQALEILGAKVIQLVLADIDLPGMSGSELARIARVEFSARVVLTSGMASDPSALEGTPFLPKPYSTDDLLRCVRRTLDRP